MAEPAFIYAFDNLGDQRFAELCGLLLASRYSGFLMGGVGPDGGVDGEIDTLPSLFGELRAETVSPLGNAIIQPGQRVVFQFKHRVTARTGQANARADLLRAFKCAPNVASTKSPCELHSHLVRSKSPSLYVLVTNVEVNSEFRAKFIEQCRAEAPEIANFEIIGLDDLAGWVTMQSELRHLYFPTIFGVPTFNLRVLTRVDFVVTDGVLALSTPVDPHNLPDVSICLFRVDVLNKGTLPSYIKSISFRIIESGISQLIDFYHNSFLDRGNATLPGYVLDPVLNSINDKLGKPLEPGRRHSFSLPILLLWQEIKRHGDGSFPAEIVVTDEIGNTYNEIMPPETRDLLVTFTFEWP